MKRKILLSLCFTFINSEAITQISSYPALCHADPLYSEYNYGGIWELDEDGQPICNFWKFLPEGQNERPTSIIGLQENEERDFYIYKENDEADIIEYYDDSNYE